MNRSLLQGQEVLSKTKREGTSIADELEMDDSQVILGIKELHLKMHNLWLLFFFSTNMVKEILIMRLKP